jgi:Phosphotransferase enzyme family
VTLDQALVEFHRAGGTRYRSRGVLAGGEVGATEAVDGDGRRVVAKWEWPAGQGRLDQLSVATGLIARLRLGGARLPKYLVTEPVEDGVLVIQGWMPGTASDDVPASVLEDLVAHNRLQSGAGRGGTGWKAYVRRSLLVGLEGYCEHGSLQRHSPATRDLLAQARAAGNALSKVDLVEDDAVHLDFHHRNALCCDGRLSAVIDCEGYRTGDRVFDLVTLAFGLSVAECPAFAQRDLWRQIRADRDKVIADAYVAHQALRQVDWSIRHRAPSDVASWLRRSSELLS